MGAHPPSTYRFLLLWKVLEENSSNKTKIPGDSSRDLSIPKRWVGHVFTFEGSRFHGLKTHRNNKSFMISIYIYTYINKYILCTSLSTRLFCSFKDRKKKETDAILAKIYVGRVHDKVLLFVVHMVLFCVCWRGCSNTNWILGKWAAWLSLNMYIHNSIHISYKCIYYMHIQSGVFFSPIKKNIWSLNWIIYITSSFPGSKSRSLWNSHI